MKIFVLDTNVLLHDPQSIYKFEENTILIPMTVIEEMDRFKKDMNETGRNARSVSRVLDMLREKGSLSKGVKMPSGGILRVVIDETPAISSLPDELHFDKADNRILAVALHMAEIQAKSKKKKNVILVTKDTNLRIKADAIGIEAEDYESGKVNIQDVYTGTQEILVTDKQVDLFHGQKWMDAVPGLQPNEYATLINTNNHDHTGICRFDQKTNRVVPVFKALKEGVWGVHPRNREQQFALDALMNDDIKLVSLIGKAGTGKTLLAIAAGLQKVAEEESHAKLLVSRPVFPMGKDIGFLPGDIEEKLAPWMQPVFDNIELLVSGYQQPSRKQSKNRGYKELLAQGIIEVEPLTYIRGRSIPNQFMIVDEAQNLTPHEIKTIITRAGEGTKIVLTGDPYQIDNPYVDASSNGLSYLVERFRGEKIAAHVTLTNGERSELAELAANLL